MILIGTILYLIVASLFVASLALAAARPMPTPNPFFEAAGDWIANRIGEKRSGLRDVLRRQATFKQQTKQTGEQL